MKFLKFFLPNLTIAMSVGLVILLYLDNRNPMMGFLYGKPFMLFGVVLALCSIAVSIMYYVSWCKDKSTKGKSTVGKFEKGVKENTLESDASQDTQA